MKPTEANFENIFWRTASPYRQKLRIGFHFRMIDTFERCAKDHGAHLRLSRSRRFLCLRLLYLFRQRRDNIEEIAYDCDIGDFKDWRFGVFVDGDDVF